MSLINKMLQDLDARRTEVPGASPYGSQVRVVPARRRIHPAWWVAVGLVLVLAGAAGWMLLWPMPKNQAVGPSSPVKIVKDADAAKGVSLGAANEAPNKTVPSVTAPPVLAAAAPEAGAMSRQAESPKPEKKAEEQPPVASLPKKPASSTTRSIATAPVAEKKAVPAKPLGVPSSNLPLPDMAPVLAGRVKEVSPQQRAENEYRKALLLVQQGKSFEAIGGLEQALQLDAHHSAARHALIGALLDAGRQEDAMRRAREGLEMDPAQSGLAMVLSRLQVERGELRPAIETLQRTLRYASDRADYQAFLAALLQRDARNAEAAEHYLQALRKSPQTGVWWMGLGISLQADGRPLEAKEAFSRAKATNSLSPDLLAFVESKLQQLQP